MYRIFCTSMYSPIEISYALAKLKVSHQLNANGTLLSMKKGSVTKGYISSNCRDYKKDAVNFIVSAGAELALTNFIPLATDVPLLKAVSAALKSDLKITPEIKQMDALDYVHQVAKPSLLNKIQTEIYKISPYQLRKQTQAQALAYLANKMSKRHLVRALSDNLKHEQLLPLLLAADSLRDAVAAVQAGGSVEEVAKQTGHPTFELLYISKERK